MCLRINHDVSTALQGQRRRELESGLYQWGGRNEQLEGKLTINILKTKGICVDSCKTCTRILGDLLQILLPTREPSVHAEIISDDMMAAASRALDKNSALLIAASPDTLRDSLTASFNVAGE